MKTKTREDRIAKTERKEDKRESRKKVRRKNGKKTKKAKNNRCKESSGRVGDLESEGRSDKIRKESKKASSREIL